MPGQSEGAKHLPAMIRAAETAGAILRTYFGQGLAIEQKSKPSDLRSRADTESESTILSVLSAAFPDHAIFSEESGKNGLASSYEFVIDPLDGTSNFLLGIPNFSVSIALLHQGVVIAGVIHIPVLSQTYSATKGGGVFCAGKKLSVNAEASLDPATISYASGYQVPPSHRMMIYDRLYQGSVKRIITNWSLAFDFCLLAAGKIEAITNNETMLYDYAAGMLIAAEAGAKITDFHGDAITGVEQNAFLASNGTALHTALVEIL